MIRVCSLASGSKGNSIYVSDDKTAILFDVGLSGIEIQRRMFVKKLDPRLLRAIVVSHEHFDHVRGVGVLSRRLKLPVYMNIETKQVISLGKLNSINFFDSDAHFSIGAFCIESFPVLHDAVDPVGFVITNGKIKIGIITDLGFVTGLVREMILGCNILIVEANHDIKMLNNGSYPWYLKQRIRRKTGHLSNIDTANLIRYVSHPNLKHVILVHISNENNTISKAIQTIKPVLFPFNTCLHVASQKFGTDLILVK